MIEAFVTRFAVGLAGPLVGGIVYLRVGLLWPAIAGGLATLIVGLAVVTLHD